MKWGLDVGYGQVKSVYASDKRIDPKSVVYPSGAGPIDRVDSDPTKFGIERFPKGAVEVMVDREPYITLIDPVHVRSGMNNLHAGYTETKDYRALFLGAATQLNTRVIDHLVTGLPVAMFKEKRGALQETLSGRHELANGREIHINKVSVLPQGLGAWFSVQNEMTAEDAHYAARDNILIVDCGHFSVDWVVLVANQVRWDCSGSTSEGGGAVIDAADKLYAREHQVPLGIGRWSQEIREAQDLSELALVRIGGEPVDLKKYLDLGAESTAKVVIGKIQESLRGLAGNVQRLIICGGSADFYEPHLRKAITSPKSVVRPQRPVIANALGFYLYSYGQG